MTRTEALKAARRLFGKGASVSEGRHPSSPEAREQALQKARAARWRVAEIDNELAERLAQLPWYAALTAERRKMQEAHKDGQGWAMYYRCRVGVANSMYVEHKSEGDNWQEAIDKAQAARGPRVKR
jgi:hypothetical protein